MKKDGSIIKELKKITKKNIMRTIFEKDKLGEMEKVISDFLAKRGLSFFDTKDPVALAKKLNFSLFLANFDDSIDGVIIVDETKSKIDKFDNNKIIAVNSSANKIRKRFIIAHELAHYIKESENNKKVVYATRDHNNDIRGFDEQEIDYMAAALLMPKDEFKKDWDNLNNKILYPNFDENAKWRKLMDKYAVDIDGVQRRISEIEIMGA